MATNSERMISASKLVTRLAKRFRNRGMVHYDDLMAEIADVPTVDAVTGQGGLMKTKEKLAEGYIWPVCMLPASVDPTVLQFLESFIKEKDELHEKLGNLHREHEQSLALIDKQERYIAELEKQIRLLQKTLDLVDKNMKHFPNGDCK